MRARRAPREGREARRAAWAARAALAALVVLLPLGALAIRCALSPEIPFVAPGPRAPWIMAPLPPSAQLQQWGRVEVPVTSFVRGFERAGPEPLRLHVRALRGFELWVNGTLAARDDGVRWREPRVVDATPWLRPGSNELRVDVARATGPALLELRAEGEPSLDSSSDWRVRLDGAPQGAAIPADDTRRNPAALAAETPREAAARVAGALAALFAAGVLGWLFARRAPAVRAAPLGAAGLALATAGWAFVFATKAARIPAAVGFDARHHLQYAAWIREKLALPLAIDGWSTYHPPLFYALSAPLLPEGEPVGAALKVLPFAGGFAVVVATFLLARRLFAGDGASQLLAVGFAAVLPVNLYSAAYFSNEPFHAGLAGLLLWLGADSLLAERIVARRVVLLGLVLGLAALTKFTALLLAPALGLVVAWRSLATPRAGLARAAASAALLLGVAALVAGWFYLRNWLVLGDPVIGNWGSLPGAGHRWWQQPGFHTPAYYERFGEALVHPYLSGFRSFWDGLYSTLWGDGFLAGRIDPARRHDFWSYDYMSAGYLAALPVSAALALGVLRGLRLAVADGEPGRRAAHAWLLLAGWSLAIAFVYLTLRLPFFSQAKAAYLLPLAPAFAVWFALGARAIDAWLARRAGTWARAVLVGLWTLCAGTFFLGFAA